MTLYIYIYICFNIFEVRSSKFEVESHSMLGPFRSSVVRSWVIFEVESFSKLSLSKLGRSKLSLSKLGRSKLGRSKFSRSKFSRWILLSPHSEGWGRWATAKQNRAKVIVAIYSATRPLCIWTKRCSILYVNFKKVFVKNIANRPLLTKLWPNLLVWFYDFNWFLPTWAEW